MRELSTNEVSWEVGAHHGNSTEEARAEYEVTPTGGVSGMRANIRELAATMPAAMSAMKFEAFSLYAGIPYKAARVYAWADERIGKESARFLRNVCGVELKRAFCFGLRENFLPPTDGSAPGGMPTSREWTLLERARILYAFARKTGSYALAASAVELLNRDTTIERDSQQELDAFLGCPDSDIQSLPLAAARRLTMAVATRTDNISPELVADISGSCTPEAVIELASLLSFAEMWRRMLLLFTLPALSAS